MTRAMFSVTVKSGTTYCANNLNVYDGNGGKQALAFISSGRLQTVLVEDVVKVELTDGWSHCNACDGAVSHLSYAGEQPVNQA